MKITRDKNGMLTYWYAAGPDISFKFHMLCEVGAPCQEAARRIIQREGWQVDYGRSIDAAPWVADFARVPANPVRDKINMRTI